MEENCIVLNKWDIEALIGNSGCAAVDDKQYYRDEIKFSVLLALPANALVYSLMQLQMSPSTTSFTTRMMGTMMILPSERL